MSQGLFLYEELSPISFHEMYLSRDTGPREPGPYAAEKQLTTEWLSWLQAS